MSDKEKDFNVDEYFGDNPEFRKVYDQILSLIDVDEDETEVECVEFDDKEYALLKEFSVNDETYYYFISMEDPTDILLRKLLVEDDGEYFTTLDSEEEFDLVMAHLQKLTMLDLKNFAQKKAEAKAREKAQQKQDLANLKDLEKLLLYKKEIDKMISSEKKQLVVEKSKKLAESLLANCSSDDYRVLWGRYCYNCAFNCFNSYAEKSAFCKYIIETAPSQHKLTLLTEADVDDPKLNIVFEFYSDIE